MLIWADTDILIPSVLLSKFVMLISKVFVTILLLRWALITSKVYSNKLKITITNMATSFYFEDARCTKEFEVNETSSCSLLC